MNAPVSPVPAPGVVVPDEAVEKVAAVIAGGFWRPDHSGISDRYRDRARQILAIAAPAIVAANQPKPADDLRGTRWHVANLPSDHVDSASVFCGPTLVVSDLPWGKADQVVTAVQSYVDAQVAAARADAEGHDRVDGYPTHNAAAAGYSTWVGIFRFVMGDAVEAMNGGDVQKAERELLRAEADYAKQSNDRREAHRPVMNAAGLDYAPNGSIVALASRPSVHGTDTEGDHHD